MQLFDSTTREASCMVQKQWELFGWVILPQINKLVLTACPVKVSCCKLENWIHLNVLSQSITFVFLLSSCLPERRGVILIYNILGGTMGTCTRNMTARHNSRYSCSFPFYSSSESPMYLYHHEYSFLSCSSPWGEQILFCFIGEELRQAWNIPALDTWWKTIPI